ncbi:Chaperone protein DnaK [Candidatus Magnetomoraceae bacterium gMMP-15]
MSEIVEKSSGYVLGIDLGTTNTAVAVYKAGNAEIINIDGAKTMPSVISVLGNGEILVGTQAKARCLIDPDNTVCSIKREIGKDWKKVFDGLPDKEYTSVDLSAEILSKLLLSIQQNEEVDLGGSPKYAVICVPANFNDAQKKATKKAAELANLSVLWLLEEPVAAAYAYALERERDQTILVYDLGGGTFDVTILQVDSTESKSKNFKVLSKEGVQELGGDDFDYKLMKLVAEKLKETSKIDILDLKKDQGVNENKLLNAQQKLQAAVMTAKHELTESSSTIIDLPNIIHDEGGKPHHIDNLEITCDQFNDEIRDMIFQSREAVQKSLDDAELTIKDIDRIILVGGSTKVPLVKEELQEMFGREPYSDTDPDTAIARGAAILGATLNLPANADATPKNKDDIPSFVFVTDNIVTHNLGIEVVGGKFSCLISKGTDIKEDGSITANNQYTTPRDNMTELAIRIYQSPEDVEYISSENVKCIGEFFLTGIPSKPKGEEKIIVDFEINEQNMLKVKASSSTSSKELEINES